MMCMVLLVQDAITHGVVDLRCSSTTKGRQMFSFVGVNCSNTTKGRDMLSFVGFKGSNTIKGHWVQ